MALEIEKKFRNFNNNTIRNKFGDLNIIKNGGELFKISSFIPTQPKQTVRTRTEGDKITFTIKMRTESYDKEYEVTVNDQNMLDEMLQLLGIHKAYTLEKFREKYTTKDNKNELVFDHYPGLPPYLEIESSNETELFKLMKKLGLEDESKFTAKDLYYELYGISKDRKDSDLTFTNAEEMLGKYITKNKDQFIKILKHQQEFIKKYNK